MSFSILDLIAAARVSRRPGQLLPLPLTPSIEVDVRSDTSDAQFLTLRTFCDCQNHSLKGALQTLNY